MVVNGGSCGGLGRGSNEGICGGLGGGGMKRVLVD
jgi:hypothetical protein